MARRRDTTEPLPALPDELAVAVRDRLDAGDPAGAAQLLDAGDGRPSHDDEHVAALWYACWLGVTGEARRRLDALDMRS